MLEQLKALARKAGEIMLDTENVQVHEKTSQRDLVTSKDLEVQEMLTKACAELVPDCSFYCEENDQRTSDITKGTCFIIDPIDGTANFVFGLNHSCTSIACLEDGKAKYGVIYNPFADELFSAEAGKGSWLNDKPLYPADESLKDSLVVYGSAPYNESNTDDTFALTRAVYDKCNDVRRSGSAALDLCETACGRFHLYYELELSPWDYAAGKLIAEEAGLIVTDIYGKPLDYKGKTSILCASERIRQEFEPLVQDILG